MNKPNVEIDDPISYLLRMIPEMAAIDDKLTRLDLAELLVEAVAMIEEKE